MPNVNGKKFPYTAAGKAAAARAKKKMTKQGTPGMKNRARPGAPATGRRTTANRGPAATRRPTRRPMSSGY